MDKKSFIRLQVTYIKFYVLTYVKKSSMENSFKSRVIHGNYNDIYYCHLSCYNQRTNDSIFYSFY